MAVMDSILEEELERLETLKKQYMDIWHIEMEKL